MLPFSFLHLINYISRINRAIFTGTYFNDSSVVIKKIGSNKGYSQLQFHPEE